MGTGEEPLEREATVLLLFRFAISCGNRSDPVDDEAWGTNPEYGWGGGGGIESMIEVFSKFQLTLASFQGERMLS
jgi:hypothetical protein